MAKKYDPVTIRYKALANGHRSIYLDYKLSDGTRKLEYLKMYLLPARSAEARRLNEHTLRAVAHIKAQRLINMAWNKDANAGVADSRRLLSDVIDEYAELRTKKGAKGARGYYGSVKRYVKVLNPRIRMWEVNLEFVTGLAEYMMKTARTRSGGHLAKSTILGTLGALSAVLRYAVRKGMAPSNPVEYFDGRMVEGPTYKRVYLVAEELKRLAETPCRNNACKNLFMFACFTGLRFGDLVSLKWKDVVEEEGNIRVEKMMSKTKHMVYLPLNKVAREYLPPRGEYEDLVFKGIPRHVGPIDAALREWGKKAGIEKHITFYTSRHTFATLALTQGADLYSVSRLLGHKQVTTTEGYAEIIDLKKEEAVCRLDALFEDYLAAKDRLVAKFRLPAGLVVCEEAKIRMSDAIVKVVPKIRKKKSYLLEDHPRALVRYVEAFDGEMKLWEFGEEKLHGFVRFLEHEAKDEKGNRLCRAQVETAIRILEQVMEEYRLAGWVGENPVAGFDYNSLQGPLDTRKDLSDEELELMLDSPCEKTDIKSMFLLCCHCDLMMAHALNLTWRNILDAPNGSKLVRTTYTRYKTVRTQVIPPRVASLLPGRKGDDDLVFDFHPRMQRPVTMALERWCLSMGIYRRITFMHSQHTYCRLSGKVRVSHVPANGKGGRKKNDSSK